MASNRSRLRLVITVGVPSLAVLNALSLWGDEAARFGELVLQIVAGLGAAICGVVVAWQVTGLARWWRVLYVGALVAWAFGQFAWYTGSSETVSTPARAAYFVLPVLALSSVILLVRSSGGVTGPREPSARDPHITNVFDGVIAGISFLILAAMGGFGAGSTASLPRSGIPAVEVVFAVAELMLVAAAVVIAMIYAPDRPYRRNYLLLATGLVTMAASDRLVAYFRSVGVEGGDLWAGIGLIVGPMIIAFAMLEHGGPNDTTTDRDINWVQLVLPYVGFLGIAVLFGYHVLWVGKPLSPFVVYLTILLVLLVTTRQVLTTRAQNLLTQRLYWAQRGLAYQVHHDALTGLPNRILFSQRLDEAMRHGNFVLIFVDLDDFKEVNDRFGHAAGDELLRAVGERLRRCVNGTDTLARVGGDEFAILINGDGEQLDTVAERLRIALRDPFPVHGSSVRVRASMGLVRPDTDSQTSDDLLRQADISMYAGKRMGKNTAVVYQPSSGVTVDFPTMLRNADGEVPPGFRLVYQLVVRLPEGTPVAVEALARWTAPNGIDISPETFVAVTEAAGLGAVFDSLVMNLACREVRTAGLDLDIHVNIGAARLGNPGFEREVHQVMSRHRIPRGRLVLEITETVPIVDLDRAAAQIRRLSDVGVKIALDDFGAGFNSLTYLHCLPVHIVKLDRSLASGGDPARDLALYRSVIGLCGALGMDVIAEGIESDAQADTVYRAGGRLAQGHRFARPVPIAELYSTPVAMTGDAGPDLSPAVPGDLTQAD
ncbi:diguanylate cyclase/phosphodiesterase [Mycolicibacterium aurum]|uniref:Diguanylate cyclase/phosphodiesterase n=1 Tax=Mycolicibacterium aurum TaxID=1791 RepID=A0A3S4RQ43_MYCAU|nr:EAL domain-containing protein [Mycolicibacterium aurum]VEG52968.1 diguanylate cyclase/phosphodiesterase [Mycolicibacterium aurum]